MVYVVLQSHRKDRKDQKRTIAIKALLDSGASGSIVSKDTVKNLKINKRTSKDSTEWTTAAGTLTTLAKCQVNFLLPELSPTKTIHHKFHVTENRITNYDMVIGRDLLQELGIDLKFSNQSIVWDDGDIPMKPKESSVETSFFVEEPDGLIAETDRMSKILDAKYAKADLHQVAFESTKGLTEDQSRKLQASLEKYEGLFDGTLGKWNDSEYKVELRNDVKPYHGRPYSVPKAYEMTFRKEVERLCKIGVLKKVNRSEWAAPTFLIPKKDMTVRFITDFRELNKRIKRKPFPIPKIQDMLLKLEGFQWATSLDLNMGYYHIKLDPLSRKLCTIVLPWGKYEYQSLPMGLSNSADIFQERMSELMEGLEFVRAYIDDLLVVTAGSYEDHLLKLEEVLKRIEKAGLKVNPLKSFFCQPELEYLGYWITRDGIMPQPRKVDAVMNLAPPKNIKELRSFLGLVNYYRDTWIRRSDTLAPLSRLVSKNVKYEWTAVEQDAFDTIKRIMSREALLVHPDFNAPFEIHTDASKYQLGAVISQNNKPIAFYSRKLNSAQLNYTTTERELLAIVETLKEFRNILLGQQIVVYTDHKNLTYKVFNTDRVMRWRMICEEYGAELRYIKGEHNIVADTLSRLHLSPPLKSECDELVLETPTVRPLGEAFAFEDLPEDAFPLRLKTIQREQQKDQSLLKKVRTSKANYTLESFRGGGKERQLICLNKKIVVPSSLQKRVVSWYHQTLCHPGETCTEATIAQHLTWTNLRKEVHKQCSTCPTCQLTKRTKKKYGHLPEKEAEAIPWEKLCVDMIGPYTIKRKGKKALQLWCVTMIDPATGWFEIKEVPGTKRADIVANVVEQAWLNRYPWPQEVILDRGTEFMAEFSAMIQNDYGVKKKPITKRNPQANAIVERVHQTIGNMLRTFSVHSNNDLDESDPWSGILTAIAFAVRATVHTTTQATATQLVFGRDAIFNIGFEANWKYIKSRKQKLIRQNNRRENAKRLPYTYKVDDLVLIKKDQNSKYGSDAYAGPFTITQVNENGTVRVLEGTTSDTYNVRMITPYQS